MPDPLAAARAFLQRDLLKNIVPLKMLHAYSPALTCHYAECGADAGVLVMLPPTVFSYDAEDYPDAEWIVLLSTTGPAAAETLLDLVPSSEALVFKLFDPADREVVARRFPLRRVTGFVSYTSPPGSVWPPVAGVAVSERLDERSLAIFVARGHDRADVRGGLSKIRRYRSPLRERASSPRSATSTRTSARSGRSPASTPPPRRDETGWVGRLWRRPCTP